MITPGELSVGQYVTVLDHKPLENQSQDIYGNLQTVSVTNRSGMGNLLSIVAINLPYVIVKQHSGLNFQYTIDTRKTILMELNKQYIEALNNK